MVRLLEEGNPGELAIAGKGPTVVAAAERDGPATVVQAELVAPVRAVVQERVDLAPRVSPDDDGVVAHVRRDEIARSGDHRVVAQEQPAAVKDPLHLLFVDLEIREDPSGHESIFEVEEFPAGESWVGCCLVHHRRHPPFHAAEGAKHRPRSC